MSGGAGVTPVWKIRALIEDDLARHINADHAPYRAEPVGGPESSCGLVLVIITHPDQPGYWIAGDANEVWGADYYAPEMQAAVPEYDADVLESVATHCAVATDPTADIPSEVAHALIGSIDLYHRHGKITAYPS